MQATMTTKQTVTLRIGVDMRYPEDMTADDIMEFDYELNKQIDQAREEGQFWAINAELQIVADLQREQELVDSLAV